MPPKTAKRAGASRQTGSKRPSQDATTQPKRKQRRVSSSSGGGGASSGGNDKLTATLRVICTSPPPAKLDGTAVSLGLREKKTKAILPPTTIAAAGGGSCSWEFPVLFIHDTSRTTDAKNPFPGRLRGQFIENGKGTWNEDFYMYLRIMKNKGKDYVCGMKIAVGCISWEQVVQAQAVGSVIETRVPGPHKHKGTTTGREDAWGGWYVVQQ